MPYYVDTSAFLKLVVAEAESEPLLAWAASEGVVLFSSDLLRTEALHTARRHSPACLLEARARLEVLTLLRMTTSVFERAAELDPAILRSLDALHLAAALTVDDLQGVVTYDERLADAASHHGVAVVSPGRDLGSRT